MDTCGEGKQFGRRRRDSEKIKGDKARDYKRFISLDGTLRHANGVAGSCLRVSVWKTQLPSYSFSLTGACLPVPTHLPARPSRKSCRWGWVFKVLTSSIRYGVSASVSESARMRVRTNGPPGNLSLFCDAVRSKM